jgi:hypothetical protein
MIDMIGPNRGVAEAQELQNAQAANAAVKVRRMAGKVAAVSLLLLTWVPLSGLAQVADLTPRPGLSPEQVVQYQTEALQHNDEPKTDAGIERAFRFASPSNKQMTGPLEKFIRIVKSPIYSPMLNSVSSSIVGSDVKDDQARFAVHFVAADGRQVTYIFVLSKQNEGEFNNCWMTDGVAPLEQGEDGPDQGVTI